MILPSLGSIAVSLAQAAPAPAAAGAPAPSGPLAMLFGPQSGPLFMMAAIFGVFYFLVIRPQNRKQREMDEWLKSLKKGDEVTTNGGIFGKIRDFPDASTVLLEVADKVKIKILRSALTGKPPGAQGDKAEKPAPASSDAQPAKS